MIRWLLRAFLLVAALIGLAFVLLPKEPVAVTASFEPRKFGEGIDVYLEVVESAYDDIKPGQEKQIIWHDQKETRTPLSIVYLHGFSASAVEIQPVPELVAKAFDANVVYTRFTGHGRSSPDALAEASAQDWMEDAAEALALGRATGDRVIVISTSTGGTIAAEAALQPELVKGVAGMVFISPNFGINNPLAPLLTLPGARYWLPPLAGERRSFEPRSAAQAEGWTTEYPSVAVLPVAALVEHAVAQSYRDVDIPALFYFRDDDQVVRADITREIISDWGAQTDIIIPELTAQDDPYNHVLAGDIMSPDNTEAATETITNWIWSVLEK